VASTKPIVGSGTYAQNPHCGSIHSQCPPALRYQTNSERKSLIYIGSLNCHFSGQFNESLDLQGFAASQGNLSTKLSTENRDIFKAVKNQGLSALSVCTCEEMHTFRHTK
jgi:hypothetical protein